MRKKRISPNQNQPREIYLGLLTILSPQYLSNIAKQLLIALLRIGSQGGNEGLQRKQLNDKNK
jgi:hypothetical protein